MKYDMTRGYQIINELCSYKFSARDETCRAYWNGERWYVNKEVDDILNLYNTDVLELNYPDGNVITLRRVK